jgi:hypothetical protein
MQDIKENREKSRELLVQKRTAYFGPIVQTV